MLGRWRRDIDGDGDRAFQGQGNKPRDEEIVRLKRELAWVQKERDFLQVARRRSLRKRRIEVSDDRTLPRCFSGNANVSLPQSVNQWLLRLA